MSVSEKISNAMLRFGLVIMISIIMITAQGLSAQDKEWESPRTIYSGFEVSLGAKISQLQSSVQELNGLTLISEGGNAGFVYGSDFSRVTIKPLGFYSAVSSIGRTINLYSLEVENSTYLLRGILKRPTRFDIYSILGLNFNSNKFFGHYIDEDQRPGHEQKAGKEPYLGKLESLLISAGLGLEYKLVNKDNFVHFFLSGRYIAPMQFTTDSKAFEDTYMERNFDLSLGVRFGLMSIKSNDFSEL